MRSLRFTLSALLILVPCSLLAQQPKILAPHRPIPPRLKDSLPPPNTYSPRYLRGGLWMTGAYMKSFVYVASDLEISPLLVTPVLYLSNGLQLSLPPVTLEPSGTAVININDALASKGISPNATLSGYVELQYSWPWNALCATVSNIDATHSTIFTYGLTSMPPMPLRGSKAHSPGPGVGPQILEGAWWKQELGVTGFLALSNTTDKPLAASVRVTDANANPLGSYEITVSPHGTKRVDLQELASVNNSLGGLEVAFNGMPDALIVNGGLEDSAKGYSASIPFGYPPPASAKPASVSYAEIGLMTGQAGPMMHFPVGTVFTPYSILRNLAAKPVTVTPTLYWMEGGAALSAQLASFPLGPLQTQKLDVPSLLALGGLKNFNGSVNLILEVQGPQDSILLASGSVDNTDTYVFEVIPKAVKESASKNLSYWDTAKGDDTMVTLWNPADEPQDFQFKFLFSGGHYVLPIHLEARATRAFNVSEVIAAQSPDSEGNVIPLGMHEGSAQISGAQAENQLILIAMDAGTYNVRKATCGYRCTNCNGATSWSLATVPFATAVSRSTQLTFTATWNTGHQYNLNSSSTWTSNNTSVATVNTGLVQGVAVGSITINGEDFSEPIAGSVCGSPTPPCPPDQGVGDSGGGDVNSITVHFGPPGASLSTGDNLSFSNVAQTCSTTLGLKNCSTAYPSTWVWNVEIEADVFDDAANYTVCQGVTGQTNGYYKASDGSLKSFTSSTNKPCPQDSPPSAVLQQASGQKVIFWLDAPGRGTIYTDPNNSANSGPIDSMTDVKNFTSSICSTAVTTNCWSVDWYIKIIVKTGAILDTSNSAAGFGTAP